MYLPNPDKLKEKYAEKFKQKFRELSDPEQFSIKDFEEVCGDLYEKEENVFCHMPFHIYTLNRNREVNIKSLFVSDVREVLSEMVKIRSKGQYKKIYCSIDFPASGDIHSDFIAFFDIEGPYCTVYAKPYDEDTGEFFEYITYSKTLTDIKKMMQQSTSD